MPIGAPKGTCSTSGLCTCLECVGFFVCVCTHAPSMPLDAHVHIRPWPCAHMRLGARVHTRSACNSTHPHAHSGHTYVCTQICTHHVNTHVCMCTECTHMYAETQKHMQNAHYTGPHVCLHAHVVHTPAHGACRGSRVALAGALPLLSRGRGMAPACTPRTHGPPTSPRPSSWAPAAAGGLVQEGGAEGVPGSRRGKHGGPCTGVYRSLSP